MKRSLILFCSSLALFWVILTTTPAAATYQVNSIPDLQACINSAVAGDIIIVQNGVYTTDAPITVNRQGTLTNPIRIVANNLFIVAISSCTSGFLPIGC